MKLFLLSQSVNNGYDTYDSCVVAAESEKQARLISPCTYYPEWSEAAQDWIMTTVYGNRIPRGHYQDWARPDQLKVKCIGEAIAAEPGVICASFNAG